MDFRQYDNALGRFLCIDALSEKNHYLSPYNFADGNPVFFNDPSGLDSGMPSWLQDMWDATPNGYNTTWTNMGDGNFEVTAFWGSGQQINQSISAGSSSGGGGIAGFGIGSVYNIGTCALMTSNGNMYVNFGSSNNNSFGNGWQQIQHQLNEVLVVGQLGNINYSNATAQIVGQINGVLGNGSSGIDFDYTGHAINFGGGILGVLEGLSASNGYWLGNNGKYYSTSWGGNRYTGSRSGALLAARNFKLAGKGLTIIEAGIGIYATREGYKKDGGKFGYNAQHAAASTATGIALGIAGAKVGATIGASIGVWFGGVGAIPGAVIGGVIGGFVMGVGGSYLGGYLGGSGVDYIHGK